MSSFGLASYAEVGLVIFFVVFLAVMFRAFSPKYQAEYDAASCMPLDDELIRTPMHGPPPDAVAEVRAADLAAERQSRPTLKAGASNAEARS